MKTKQLLTWLLALVMCFTLMACTNPGATEPTDPSGVPTEPSNPSEPSEPSSPIDAETAKPLLYRVTDEDGNIVWLFGSVHVGRADYYPLPAYVLNAFDNADSLAVEVDIVAFGSDIEQQMEALSCMVYRDGSTIKDHIPQELYTKSVAALKSLNNYTPALDLYCPAFWSSMIDSSLVETLGGDTSLGIDNYLLERAYKNKKEVLEVESALFQYQMLTNFSDELQAMLLESSVQMCDELDLAREDLKKLMDLWASGDEQAFAAHLAAGSQDMTAEEALLYEEYTKAMRTDRNLSMANYAETALQSGKEVFICVGAAHIVGDGAMAQLLAQRGYTVECITSNS